MAKTTIAQLELRIQQLEGQLLALSAAVEKTTAAQAAAAVATAPKQKAASTLSREAWMEAVKDLQEQFANEGRKIFPREWIISRAKEIAEDKFSDALAQPYEA